MNTYIFILYREKRTEIQLKMDGKVGGKKIAALFTYLYHVECHQIRRITYATLFEIFAAFVWLCVGFCRHGLREYMCVCVCESVL